jgi:hypothetical protein
MHLSFEVRKYSEHVNTFLQSIARGITTLDIEDTQFFWQDKNYLKFRRLKELHLNNIHDSQLLKIPNLIHLEKLYLYNISSYFKGEYFQFFNKLSFLFLLGNHHCVKDELMNNIKEIKFLKKLHFDNIYFNDIQTWTRLRGFTNLEELVLRSTNIPDEILKQLVLLPKLRVLRLLENRDITAKGVLTLKDNDSLATLEIVTSPRHKFNDDLLLLIWKILPMNVREEFCDLCNLHEFKDATRNRVLKSVVYMLEKRNHRTALKLLLDLAKNELGLTHEELDELAAIFPAYQVNPRQFRDLREVGTKTKKIKNPSSK